MHTNPNFNIVQAAGNCNPLFNVIEGRRTDSGHMAHGAKVLSGPALPRDQAIELADKLQAAHNAYMEQLLAAQAIESREERRYHLDGAHLRYSEACEALGVQLPE